MSTTEERLLVLIEADARQYTRGMQQLVRTTEAASASSVAALGRLEASVMAIGKSMFLAFGGAAAGVLALTELPRAVLDIVEKMKTLEDQAKKIGVTTDALQELQIAARDAGVDSDSLAKGLAFFGKALSQAAAGAGNLAPLLKANGLALRDTHGNMIPVLDQLKRFADLVKNATSDQDRLNLVATAFGRNATDLVNVFREGGAALDGYMAKAKATGQVIDADLVAKGAELAPKWASFTQSLTVNFQSFVLSVIDGTAKASGALNTFFDDLQKKGGIQLPFGITFGAGHDPLEDSINAAIAAADAAKGKGDVDPLGMAKVRAKDALRAGLVGTLVDKPTVVPNVAEDAAAAALDKAYAKLAATLKLETANLQASTREQFIANQAASLDIKTKPEQIAQIKAFAGALYDAKKAQADLNSAATFFGQTAYNALDSLILKGGSFNDVLKTMLVQLAEAALQASLLGQGPLAGLFGSSPTGNLGIGGVFGSLAHLITGRAAGGPVIAGHPYLVNENTPRSELFIPGVSGRIVPSGGVGGGSSNLHVSVDVRGARGNKEIEQMVAQGVHTGLLVYDKTKSRQAELAA